jgi:hypothetical protein
LDSSHSFFLDIHLTKYILLSQGATLTNTPVDLTNEEMHMIINALDFMYIHLKSLPYQIQRNKSEVYAELAMRLDLEAMKTSRLTELAERLIEDLQLQCPS